MRGDWTRLSSPLAIMLARRRHGQPTQPESASPQRPRRLPHTLCTRLSGIRPNAEPPTCPLASTPALAAGVKTLSVTPPTTCAQCGAPLPLVPGRSNPHLLSRCLHKGGVRGQAFQDQRCGGSPGRRARCRPGARHQRVPAPGQGVAGRRAARAYRGGAIDRRPHAGQRTEVGASISSGRSHRASPAPCPHTSLDPPVALSPSPTRSPAGSHWGRWVSIRDRSGT